METTPRITSPEGGRPQKGTVLRGREAGSPDGVCQVSVRLRVPEGDDDLGIVKNNKLLSLNCHHY